MLNPYTFVEERKEYRDNSTLAIVLQRNAIREHEEKLKRKAERKKKWNKFVHKLFSSSSTSHIP